MLGRIFILFISIYLGLNAPLCRAAENPNLLGNKGLQLIQEGKEAEGLDLIRQAIQADPQIPDWHMNYGSMLFLKGQKIFQSGNTQEAKKIFKESEKELLLATQLFKEADGKLTSHCYFLLGDIYQYAYGEQDKAKEYYEKSLTLYPKHGGAKSALNDIVEK